MACACWSRTPGANWPPPTCSSGPAPPPGPEPTTLGGRAVLWEVVPGGVAVAHASADPAAAPLAYTVGMVTTTLPTGGVRWWWVCPGCGRRVDSLYLPPGRERLGCRGCCRLAYRSQRTRERGGPRKARPVVLVERIRTRWAYSPAAGRLVLVVHSKTVRRF